MIEIEREEKPANFDDEGRLRPDVVAKYRWHVRGRGEIGGMSREPLLDACRALAALGEAPETDVGIFRPGSSVWDMRTTVGYGSNVTVQENAARSPRFVPYKSFGRSS